MKIKIKKNPLAPSFEEYVETNGFEIEVVERDEDFHNTEKHYFAHFLNVSLYEEGFQVGLFGSGANPRMAIENLARTITGLKWAKSTPSGTGLRNTFPEKWRHLKFAIEEE